MENVYNKCRACLEFEGEKLLTESHKEYLVTFTEILYTCTTIKANHNIGLPTKLCKNCVILLTSFYEFKLKVIKCDKTLKQLASKFLTRFQEDSNSTDSNKEVFSCSETSFQENSNGKDNNIEITSFEVPNCVKIKLKPLESTKITPENEVFRSILNKNTETGTKPKNIKPRGRIKTETNFVCNICNKSFTRNDHLATHQRIHTGERPFKCKICSKSFIQQTNLTLHLRTHTGEKPHMCDMCGKSFSQSASLAHHVKTHLESSTLQHKCQICTKSFAHSGNLNVHMRFHNNIRNFSCETCKKSFVTSSNLVEHAKQHTNVRNEICMVCEKGFFKKQHLKNHMVIHNGERAFECNVCFKNYTQAAHLKRHKKSHCVTIASEIN